MLPGCIENLAPEGLENLREAKAELLRAQTALQAANAAKAEAEAALTMAYAKVQEAIALQEQAKVAYFEAQALAEKYKAELLGIQNEAERAELEVKLAEAEAAKAAAQNEAALAAERFKIDMLDVTAALAEAQLAYEQALADLEISKTQLTPKQQAFLTSKMNAVIELKMQVEDFTELLAEASNALAEATAELDEPTANRVALKRLERKVTRAEAKLEAALEAVAEAEALLQLDPLVTDWAAQKDALDEELKAMEKERDAKVVEAAERAKVSLDSMEVLAGKAQEYTAYAGFEFNEQTGLFSKVPGDAHNEIEVPEIYVAAPLDAEGNAIFGLSDFYLSESSYQYGREKDFVAYFDEHILNLSAYNTDAYQEMIDNLQEQIEAAKANNDYKMTMARYEAAVAAYTAGDYLSYLNKYVYEPGNVDFEELVADYNDALAAFEKAVADYEKTFVSINVSDEYAALYAAYTADLDAAYFAKVTAYQRAVEAFASANQKYVKATSVHKNAKADYDRKMASYTSEASRSQMESYVTDYEAFVALGLAPEDGGYDTAVYNRYKANLTAIAAAQKAYDDLDDPENKKDAKSVYELAKETYNKAIADRDAARSAADQTYYAAREAAELKYENAYDELQASVPSYDPEYKDYFTEAVYKTRDNLDDAMNELAGQLEGVCCEYGNRRNVSFNLLEGTGHDLSISLYVPDCLTEETLDLVTGATYKLVPAVLNEVQDAEYFLNNIIAAAADELTYVSYYFYALGTDANGNSNYVNDFRSFGVVCEGYPLTLPDYDAYVAYLNSDDFKYQILVVENDLSYQLNSMGYSVDYSDYFQTGSAPLSSIYSLQDQIADYESGMANITLVPDFVKAIEAAKAEFEAFAAEKAVEIEALKADVEANYPRLLAEVEAVKEEAEAYEEKVEVLEYVYTVLANHISKYCEGYDKVEDFVEMLENAYEDALQNAFDKEEELVDAQQALKAFNEGLVTAVEVAQKEFDKCTEALQVSQELLDIAVAELDAAIALVYGNEEIPEETPETPEETPAE